LRRLYPNHPVVGVGAVLIHNGKILIEKRKNELGRGKWSIPGGLVELGEKAEETVIREVKEETNLAVSRPHLVDVVENVETDETGDVRYHYVIIDYFAKIESGLLRAASDAAELKWVTFDEVKEFDLTESFRDFLVRNSETLRRFDSDS
jgi:8-oxo-dGTP diphosphatase